MKRLVPVSRYTAVVVLAVSLVPCVAAAWDFVTYLPAPLRYDDGFELVGRRAAYLGQLAIPVLVALLLADMSRGNGQNGAEAVGRDGTASNAESQRSA